MCYVIKPQILYFVRMTKQWNFLNLNSLLQVLEEEHFKSVRLQIMEIGLDANDVRFRNFSRSSFGRNVDPD